MHIIMKTSGDIRSSRPLRAMLAGLLLLAVSATAADTTPPEDPEVVKPPAPADVTVTKMYPEQCLADIKWTQENPDNINLTGFEYRTKRADSDSKWGSWMSMPGGASIRRASVAGIGGSQIQMRVTVAQEGADHSDPSSTVANASDLDPDHPACQGSG